MTLLIFAATALQIAEQVIPEGADAKLVARIVDLLARISAAQRAATATATIPKLIYGCLRSRVEHRGVDEAHRASRQRLAGAQIQEIGRASCRESVWQNVWISVSGVLLKK